MDLLIVYAIWISCGLYCHHPRNRMHKKNWKTARRVQCAFGNNSRPYAIKKDTTKSNKSSALSQKFRSKKKINQIKNPLQEKQNSKDYI